jgi:glycosyltransferase involved in cell wall biosynthesis
VTSPLVSIVVVSFNQARFLEEALTSVLDQTYPNIECIVCDGGSRDGSAEIIDRYRSRIAQVRMGPDGGPPAALNLGFGLARGEIYAYLNSDDVLCANAVERWVDGFGRFSDADILYGDIDIVDEQGLPSHLPDRKVSTFLAVPFSIRQLAAGAAVIPQQASAWRTEVFKLVGGFREDNGTCWDYEFFTDAAIQGFHFRHINGVFAKFRVHDQSISGTGRSQEQRVVDHARIQDKWTNAGFGSSRLHKRGSRALVQAHRTARYLLARGGSGHSGRSK